MNRPACLPPALFAIPDFGAAVEWVQVEGNLHYTAHVADGCVCYVHLLKYVFYFGGELLCSFVGVCPHRIAFYTEPALLGGCEPSDTPAIVEDLNPRS